MTLKIVACFILGAAVGYVIWVKILDLICELVREWNDRNWWIE
jgi:hypothetical protein